MRTLTSSIALAAGAVATLLVVAAAPCVAHPAAPSAQVAASAPTQQTSAALRLNAEPAPLAARYGVLVTSPSKAAGNPAPRRYVWYFYRDAERIALLKGNIDESWYRDARGYVSFERVFHEEQRAVDYSPGELATLGVQADWLALSSFIDPRELASLKLVSRSGQGTQERVRLAGSFAGHSLSVDWLPALQLPSLVLRRYKDGSSTRFELEKHAARAPADWPVPGARSGDYVRLDAADFGDMEYEPVVKKSEALDIRSGWRSEHRHD